MTLNFLSVADCCKTMVIEFKEGNKRFL